MAATGGKARANEAGAGPRLDPCPRNGSTSEMGNVRLRVWALVALALAVAMPRLAAAQDAGGEAEAETEPVEDRWGAEIGFALNTSGGNEDLTVLTTELGLSHLETTAYELTFRGRFRYGRSDGTEVARNLRGTLNAELWPGESWSPFIFATAEHDPFRRLDVRLNSGSGIKRTFWRQGWSDVSLSSALLYEHERIAPDALPAEITHKARWSFRGRARHRVREGARVEQVVFFRPAWGRVGDYLLEAQTTGRVALSESLAVTSSFLFQRDSTPPTEVSPDDWSLTIGLSLATGW
jgi:hypothetical protein